MIDTSRISGSSPSTLTFFSGSTFTSTILTILPPGEGTREPPGLAVALALVSSTLPANLAALIFGFLTKAFVAIPFASPPASAIIAISLRYYTWTWLPMLKDYSDQLD